VNGTRRRIAYGLAAGALAAAADAVLIVVGDPAASGWTIVQAMLFWASAGLAVVTSDSGLGDVAHGILGTLLLSLPWYANLALAPGRPEMLAPLLAMGMVFGAGFGAARRRLRRGA
jgi:hypothetical protein